MDPRARILIDAYRMGAFPMARSRLARGVEWFSPDPRAVIPLEAPRPPRSLRRTLASARFLVSADQDFEGVVRACARRRPERPQTWINPEIIEAYSALHTEGFAHSVEARRADGTLVGGLYGVAIAGAFFGESMFSRPDLGGTDSSKCCFFRLVEHLRARGFALLDSQVMNDHVRSLGAVDIPREEYLSRLDRALALEVTWGDFPTTP